MKIFTKCLLLSMLLTGIQCGYGPVIEGVNTPPEWASCSIYDATHNDGNEHFYFRQPIVSNAVTSGTFDPSQKPVVEICIWNGSSCGASLALFNEYTGEGSEAIRVDTVAEQYIVNWHTDNILVNYPLSPGETYRIRVMVGNQLLGYADLAVVNSGKDLKNVDTNEYVPLLDGRTLPIKFRIEEGALLTAQENMSSGVFHSCAIDAAGQAWCWGINNYGELGNGTRANQNTPVPVVGGHTFRAIKTGYYHTCAITTDDEVYCWGYNIYGQVGNSMTSYVEPLPVPVTGGRVFAAIEASGYTTCGLTRSGEFLCWGNNMEGQFGTGSAAYAVPAPVPAAPGINVTSFGVAGANICVLDESQAAYCAGDGNYGVNGNGSTGDTHAMLPVSGGHAFRSLHLNYLSACGIDPDNNAWCWGYNYFGQVGNGERNILPPQSVLEPDAVVGGIPFRTIARGIQGTCGISTDGDAYCWGYNNYGQIGTGSTAPLFCPSPLPVIGGYHWLELDPGYYHTCGITDTGDVYCWGDNYYGQLGDGTNAPSYLPVPVTGF